MLSLENCGSSSIPAGECLEAAEPRGLNLIRNQFRGDVPPKHRENLYEFNLPSIRLRPRIPLQLPAVHYRCLLRLARHRRRRPHVGVFLEPFA